MGRTYKCITYDQRIKIKEMLDNGCEKKEIAKVVGVRVDSIYREIERGSVNGQYDPAVSEQLKRQKLSEKGKSPILSVDSELAEYIAKLILEEKRSVEQIVLLLKREKKFEAFPKSKPTIYNAIDRGLIPGVTRDSLRSDVTVVYHGGQIHIAKWVRDMLNINDGDKLCFEVVDGKLIFSKEGE